MTRELDLVLFGATGFTGGLVAEYLAAKGELEPGRWALAGRDAAKLERVRLRLEGIDLRCEEVGLIEADVGDAASLRAMARRARVVISTVGPYVRFGEPVVEACVAEGADYVDITGEPAFVERTLTKHAQAAEAAGVRVVSCCGFDSIPHDLGAWLCARALPEGAPKAVEGFVEGSLAPSGGSWQSVLDALGDLRGARSRSRGGDEVEGRRVSSLPARLHWEPRLDCWAVPMPTIDPDVVKRSARALPEFGPDFRYGHYLQVRRKRTLVGGALGLGALVAAAQLPPLRRALGRLRPPGEGPSAATRAASWFCCTYLGEGGGRRARVDVSGGDPGYDETAKMLAEAALCLARDRDRLPERLDVLTTASAMGEPLLARLRAAGLRFDVASSSAR